MLGSGFDTVELERFNTQYLQRSTSKARSRDMQEIRARYSQERRPFAKDGYFLHVRCGFEMVPLGIKDCG